MKKKILFGLFIILIYGFAFSEEISVKFDDINNLPDGIIFCEKYYEETKNIFLKMENYTNDYSKIVEYDTNKKEIKNTIFTCEKGFSIKDFSSSNNGFVFSVNELRHSNEVKTIYSDLYYFDCNTNILTKLNNLPISKNEQGSLYPCRPCINDNYIIYLNQDFESQESQIILYNLTSRKLEVIITEKFSRSTSGITFINIDNNFLIYNRFNKKNKSEIQVYDLNNRKEIKTIKALESTSIHYAGCYDSESNLIILYASSSKYGDLIYLIDAKTGKNQKLVGFRDYTVIKNDQMYFDGRRIMYTIQRDISGRFVDHYYAEVYDLYSFKSMQRLYTAYCFITKDWLGFLNYDKEKNIRQINMDITSR